MQEEQDQENDDRNNKRRPHHQQTLAVVSTSSESEPRVPVAADAMNQLSTINLSTLQSFPLQTTPTLATRAVRRFACNARNLDGHNELTAYLEVPVNAAHGLILTCSHPACAASGRRFRWCQHCRKPVAKRNFARRHDHGLLIHDEGQVFFPSDIIAYQQDQGTTVQKHSTGILQRSGKEEGVLSSDVCLPILPPPKRRRTANSGGKTTPIQTGSTTSAATNNVSVAPLLVLPLGLPYATVLPNAITLQTIPLLTQARPSSQPSTSTSLMDPSNIGGDNEVNSLLYSERQRFSDRRASATSMVPIPKSPSDQAAVQLVQRFDGSHHAHASSYQQLTAINQEQTLPATQRVYESITNTSPTFGDALRELEEVLGDFDKDLEDFHGSWQLEEEEEKEEKEEAEH